MHSENKPYRVLARKYRPQNFDELIGQDTLVRILKNAIESGRIAHAFMLTGVRGVGKTTTARIIARALNYRGPDGTAEPTTGSTDDCAVCQAIAEDRHPDVMEMDAASRTGVDDIREILDGVRYAPTDARYKIYIIDEVHMLSKNAFNALLKTLEEPPPHVKFIFATTEIRKVPITVLSRCQRFDLRRVEAEVLITHFKSICVQEGVSIEDEAVRLIARAADGSVRDGLSLLDQAIALSGDAVTAQQVHDMLGLADQSMTLDVLADSLRGKTQEALAAVDALYGSGASPVALIQDMLDWVHMITRLKAVPGTDDRHHTISSGALERAQKLADTVSMPSLGKAWQILLKGLNEVRTAPAPQKAAEMVVIRLIYAANLPDPQKLIKKIQDGGDAPRTGQADTAGEDRAPAPPPAAAAGAVSMSSTSVTTAGVSQPIESLQDIVSVLENSGEFLLAGQVFQDVRLVRLKAPHVDIQLTDTAPPNLAQALSAALRTATGDHWVVKVSGAGGNAIPTLSEQDQAQQQEDRRNVIQMPPVRDMLKVFPEAELIEVKTNRS